MIKVITRLYEDERMVNEYTERIDETDEFADIVTGSVCSLYPLGWDYVEFLFYDEDGKLLFEARVDNEA